MEDLLDLAFDCEAALNAFQRGEGDADRVTKAVRALRSKIDRACYERGEFLLGEDGTNWFECVNSMEGAWTSARKREPEVMALEARNCLRSLRKLTGAARRALAGV